MSALPSHALRPLPAAPAGWQPSAACRFADRDLFFLPEEERLLLRAFREAAAQQICRGWPVRGEGLGYALVADESYGVWDGLSSTDGRKRLRRKARRGA